VFTPTAHQVGLGETVTTGFTIKATDSAGASTSDATTSVLATAVPSPPTIAGSVAGRTTTDLAAVAPFSKVSLGDPNIGQTETVMVSLSAAANGVLGNLGSGSYNSATGVYTVIGSATAVTAALDALVFTPTPHQNKAGQTVTTTFAISDTDTAGGTASDSTTTVIATSSTVIEAAGTPASDTGATSLVQVGNQYAMVPTGGSTGPVLKLNGSAVTLGQFGSTVNPIGAEAISGGYEVAWKVSGLTAATD
jgi:hypothetical protein